MRYILLQVTFFILLVSCNKTDEATIIQDKEAYSIINEFLLDSLNTIDLFAIETIEFWNLNLNPNGPPKGAPYYISFNDRLFDGLMKANIIDSCAKKVIIKELSHSKKFKWDSSKIKLRCFSLKDIDQPKKGLVNKGPWDKIGQKYNSRQFLILSIPIYINKNTVLLSVNRMCNGLCGNGKIQVLSKVNNKWSIIYETFTWIS
jgi:hypothetical protein